jgi:ribosomal protein S27AE
MQDEKYREHVRRVLARQKTPHGAAVHARAVAAYRARDKVKKAAHDAISKAVYLGKLQKQPCELCGDTNVEAHHDDYTKRMEVRWLCVPHHKALHRSIKSSAAGAVNSASTGQASPPAKSPAPGPDRKRIAKRQVAA